MRNVTEYLRAGSAAEAVQLMRGAEGRGRYLAGATDLLLEDDPTLDYVVDLRGAGLNGIATDPDGSLVVGACATLRALEIHPAAAGFAGGALARAAAACANRPVRSTATVGGNLCTALPSADMAPVLLALDACAVVSDGEDEETLPLTSFFTGPRATVLGDRILVGLRILAPAPGLVCLNRKLSRTAEDISLVQVAVALAMDGEAVAHAAVALGAVAPIPLRAVGAEAILAGIEAGEFADAVPVVAQAAADACDPIDDHRAGAEYRRAMVEVLTRRLLLEAAGLESAPDDHAHGGAR